MPILIALIAIGGIALYLRNKAQQQSSGDPGPEYYTPAPAPSVFAKPASAFAAVAGGAAQGVKAAGALAMIGAADKLISGVKPYAPAPTPPAVKPPVKPAPLPGVNPYSYGTQYSLWVSWNTSHGLDPATGKPRVPAPLTATPPPIDPGWLAPTLGYPPPLGDFDIAPPTYRDEHDHPPFETAEQAETYVTKGASSF